MRELEKKHRARRMLYSLPSIIILLIIAFFMAKAAYHVYTKDKESAELTDSLKEKITSLSGREATIEADIERLNTDEGKVEEIKRKFNVASPGEHIAVVTDAREKPATTTDESRPWYKRIWNDIISK